MSPPFRVPVTPLCLTPRMHVTVSSTFPEVLRPEMESLVRAGFADVACDDVEAHVKARGRKRKIWSVRYQDGTRIRHPGKLSACRAAVAAGEGLVDAVEWAVYANPDAHEWTARSYDGVPRIARVQDGIRYLVTFNIPADPRECRYPITHQDPRLKTSPVVTFGGWQENLLHIAAHEARHIHQFRHGRSRSELDAERWAARRLLVSQAR